MSLSIGIHAAQDRGTVVNIGSPEPRCDLLWYKSENTKFSMSVLFRQLSLRWKKYHAIWQKLLDHQAALLDREQLVDLVHGVQDQTQTSRGEIRARPVQIPSEMGRPTWTAPEKHLGIFKGITRKYVCVCRVVRGTWAETSLTWV